MWLALISTALAAPLVHDDDVPAADAAEQASTAGITEGLEPTSLSTVRAAPPWTRSGRALGPCTPGDVDAGVVRGHLLYGEFDEARERLSAERSKCGGPPSARAELERAAGLLALSDGDAAAATQHFATAKGFDPALSWDTGFPADQQAIFDAAEPHTARLDVGERQATIDGQPATEAAVAVGVHGVVIGELVLSVDLPEGGDVLVIPGAFPETLPPLADPASRLALTRALSASLGEAKRVHVLAPDGVWTGTTGRVDWTQTPLASPPPLPDATARRTKAPWWVAGAGGLVAGVGASLAGINSLSANDLADEMGRTTDRTRYDDLLQEAEAANGRVRIGQGIAAGGAGVALVGISWGVLR